MANRKTVRKEVKQARTVVRDDYYEEVTQGNLLRWDEPKEVEGLLVGKTTVTGQFGEQLKATLELDDGNVVDFYAPAMLARLLSDPRVQPGRRIRIVFPGTFAKSKAGRPVKEFRVFVAKD